MTHPRKILTIALVAASILTTGWLLRVEPATAQTEPGREVGHQHVVVHLSHFTDDLHRCFMALKTANMVVGKEADVILYLDLEGVRLAERRQHLDVTWGKSETTLQDLYDEFTQAGGKVFLCPHCAEGARIGDMALRRHAEVASMPRLSQMWLEADKVIDY